MPRRIDQDGVTIIELDRQCAALDGQSLEALDQMLAELTAGNTARSVLLDAACTQFMDSNFLEVLIRFWKRISQRGGQLALCCLSPECKEVIRATRLDTIWPLYASRDEAIRALGAASR